MHKSKMQTMNYCFHDTTPTTSKNIQYSLIHLTKIYEMHQAS